MKQEVDVVFSSADGQHSDVMVLRDSCEISPETRLQFLFYDFTAALGAKEYVHAKFWESVRECVAPCSGAGAKKRRRPGEKGVMVFQPASHGFRPRLIFCALRASYR